MGREQSVQELLATMNQQGPGKRELSPKEIGRLLDRSRGGPVGPGILSAGEMLGGIIFFGVLLGAAIFAAWVSW